MRLGAAVLCAALIGVDREIKHKPVGIRAYILVCLGSAVFSLLTMELFYQLRSLEEVINIDPSRVIQGVVGGIGFLGAGAIIQSRNHVKGAATGAGIWLLGAIGIACGFGHYVLAFTTTLIAVIVLSILGYLRAKLNDELDEKDVKQQ